MGARAWAVLALVLLVLFILSSLLKASQGLASYDHRLLDRRPARAEKSVPHHRLKEVKEGGETNNPSVRNVEDRHGHQLSNQSVHKHDSLGTLMSLRMGIINNMPQEAPPPQPASIIPAETANVGHSGGRHKREYSDESLEGSIPRTGLGKRFREIDGDLSGTLSRKEFYNSSSCVELKFTDAESALVFDSYDFDGSGELGYDEFTAGVRSERTGQSHFSALAVDSGKSSER